VISRLGGGWLLVVLDLFFFAGVDVEVGPVAYACFVYGGKEGRSLLGRTERQEGLLWEPGDRRLSVTDVLDEGFLLVERVFLKQGLGCGRFEIRSGEHLP